MMGLRSPEKCFWFFFISLLLSPLHGEKFINGPVYTTCVDESYHHALVDAGEGDTEGVDIRTYNVS